MAFVKKYGILALGMAALVLSAQPAWAADGTWTNLENAQLWGTAGNWTNNIIADGSGSAADFSTLDIEADTMVRMDAPHTMSSLAFGDTRPTNRIPAGWILDNNGNRTNVLTLAGAYTITVNTLSTGRCAAINVPLAGGNGLIKAGAGTLSVAGAGNNSLPVGQALVVNGGTLDIGASSQYVGSLSGAGGWITGSGTLTINQGSSLSFNGSFSNAVNLVKDGGSTLTLTNGSAMTGTISLVGGGLTLKDDGALSGAAGIGIAFATLTIDNTGTKDLADRVNNAAALTLDGGTITYRGRDSTASSETLGAVTNRSGMSTVTVTPGSGNSAVLTLASFTRNSGAVVNAMAGGGILGATGSNPRLVLTPAPSLKNGMIPGMIVNNSDLAGYIEGQGIGAIGNTASGFPSYKSGISGAGPTDNVFGGGTVASGGQTINANAQGDIAFVNSDDLLTLNGGMYTHGGESCYIGTTSIRGRLTSGLASGELFITKQNGGSGGGASGNINSVITDNGGTRVKLVIVNFDRDDLQNQRPYLTASNSYSGGTFLSGGNTCWLGASSSGWTTIPAANDPTQGLIINSSAVTMLNYAGQIHSNNIVTLNGGSTLTLTGNNTLAGLVFNGNGGAGTPTVNPVGVLTLTGDLASTPKNVAITPIINGATLDLNTTTNHTFTVSAMLANPSVSGLTISSTIQNGGFTKAGAGVLYLSANNTYTNETRVAGGVLRANSGAGLPTASLLTLSGGVLETSGTLARTNGAAANHMQITGGASGFSAYGGALTVAFGSTGAPTALTWGDALFNPSALVLNDLSANNTLDFKNAINLGAGNRTINVNANTATLSGSLSGSGGGLTKGGAGTLILPVANTYNGATAVNGGALVLGASGSIANSKSLTVAAGAVLDVTAKGTYTMQADETYTLGVDSTGAGSAGRIAAAGLDITNGKVTLSVTGTLNDSIYVLATYTSLAGGKFAGFGGLPSGYRLVYRENYIALFSRQVSGLVMVVR